MKSTVYKLKIKSAYETPRNIGKSLWFKFEMVLLTFQSLDKYVQDTNVTWLALFLIERNITQM